MALSSTYILHLEEKRISEVKKESFNAHLVELARQLSIPVKVNDIAGTNDIISTSALTNMTSWVQVENSFGEILYSDKDSTVSCDSEVASMNILYNGSRAGQIVSCLKDQEFSNSNIYITIAIVWAMFLSVILLLGIIARKSIRQMNEVEEFVQNIDPDNLDKSIAKNFDDDLSPIYGQMFKLMERVKNSREREEELKVYEALAKQARQLHHNIQHPLNNLKELIRDISPSILDGQRSSLRGNYNSIVDTVNNLKTDSNSKLVSDDKAKTYVNMSLDYIVSWNRANWRSKDVEIVYEEENVDKGIFIDIPQSIFPSIMHNLIKNAVEAGESDEETTVIRIELKKLGTFCELKISDNGCGISKDDLPEIFDEDFSKGKIGGSGIGLSHAKEFVSKVKGSIKVDSTPGEGSCFTITVPLSETPNWYIDEIIVKHKGGVIVLDDEYHYYRKLKKRLEPLGIESLYFKDKESFESKFSPSAELMSDYLFIVDYEFSGKNYNGIEIIQELEIFDNAVLMTNMADEHSVIKSCEECDVSLVPKKLAANIEIRKATKNIQDLKVKFLDDSKHIMRNFKVKAEKYGLDADFYTCPNELYESCKTDTDKNTVFFIDYDLGKITGDKVIYELRERGFENFHLLTGYSASDLSLNVEVTSIEPKKFPRKIIDSYL
ncbi:MAG: HAMP domain-containing histidine kinase [Oligoflexia bacterium]|nr:HAMP domain-containing histidine kinase [Oligoflexia bacterium]